MRPIHSITATLLTVLPIIAIAEDFGPIHFTPPDGWQATPVAVTDGNETRIYAPPPAEPGKQAVIILIVSPRTDGPVDLAAAFDLAIKGAVGNRKILRASEITRGKSRDGYDVVSQTVTAATDEANTNLMMIRATAALVDNRMATFCYIANDAATFEKHHPAFTTLLSGTRLGDRARPAEPAPAAVATTPAVPAPAANLPAADDVIKHQDAHRKPGFVRGRVFGADGKPFAMKGVTVQVQVFGTTYGGKRTGYDIRVAADGTYSMRVPDGIYRVLCEAQIPFDGQTLPIQLDAADGKPFDNDENSADPGISKDWILKLSGERAGGGERHGYNGWDVRARDGGDAFNWFGARGANTPRVFLTLTPTSPLLDGSKGRVIEYECDTRTLGASNNFPGTPIASYRVTGKIVYPDGSTRPALLADDPLGTRQSDHLDITFRPNKGIGGLVTPYVYVTDMKR